MGVQEGFYSTILSKGEGLYREKGSKFISFAFPVHSVEEIRDILVTLRKKYYDARHICYAYMLGADRKEFRANDDGEPSGTAGRPILGQLNSRELTNVLVVVIRYFGGILLGTGGLITAYREAASDALENAGKVQKQVEMVLTIYFDYPLINEVMRRVKEQQSVIIAQDLRMSCTLQVITGLESAGILIQHLEKMEGVKVDY